MLGIWNRHNSWRGLRGFMSHTEYLKMSNTSVRTKICLHGLWWDVFSSPLIKWWINTFHKSVVDKERIKTPLHLEPVDETLQLVSLSSSSATSIMNVSQKMMNVHGNLFDPTPETRPYILQSDSKHMPEEEQERAARTGRNKNNLTPRRLCFHGRISPIPPNRF